MSIPAFRADGWLPEGHHAADWEEISAVFGGEPGGKRCELLNRLLQWRNALRDKGMSGLLILNGSFISQKERPGDVDAIFVYDDATVLIAQKDADAALLLNHVSIKASGLGDVFVFAERTVNRFPAMCRLDGFDRIKDTNALKGVLEVII